MSGGCRCSFWIPKGIAALSLLLILTGCWDRMEINDVAFVMVSSNDIDEEGNLIGNTKIAIPSGLGSSARNKGGGGQSGSFIVSEAKGRDINEVIQFMQRKLPRRLNISHRRVLYIGEDLAKKGIGQILDHYTRNPTSRHIAYVLIAKGRKGSDFVNMSNPLERIPGEEIRELERLNTGALYSLRDYLMTASGPGSAPVLGVVEMGKSGGRAEIKLGGSAVFVKDKLVGYLTVEQSKVMQLITNRIKYYRVSAPVPEGKGIVSMQMIHAKTSIKPLVAGEKVTLRLKIRITGEVIENTTKLDMSKPQLLEKAQKALQEQIRKKVELAIEQVQGIYRTDVFGFGEAIFRSKPKDWKRLEPQWDAVFPNAEVIVQTEVVIRNAGMSGKSLHLKD